MSNEKLAEAAELLSALAIEGAQFLRRLSCYERVEDTDRFYDAIVRSEAMVALITADILLQIQSPEAAGLKSVNQVRAENAADLASVCKTGAGRE